MSRSPLIEDILRALTARLRDHEQAKKAIRAICRYYGGQQLYIPRWKKENSRTAEELGGLLADALGDSDGDAALDELMSKFGSFSHYIPKENGAFRTDIAKEIYEKYDSKTETLGDLCREYNLSYVQIYRLWHIARDEKSQQHFDF